MDVRAIVDAESGGEAAKREARPLARAWFEIRAAGLRAKRLVEDRRRPPRRGRPFDAEDERGLVELARSVTPLFSGEAGMEALLEAGKVHNVRLAARAVDRRAYRPGEVFSFWREVGAPTRLRGFAVGREIREGCLVPTIGGGLCQLSNALHDAAERAGLIIVERHRHSVVVPGSLAEAGRDATVFYNYVDLRFTSERPFAIRATLEESTLVVAILAPHRRWARRKKPALVLESENPRPEPTGSCVRCAQHDCASYAPALAQRHVGRAAYLLDGYSEAIDRWVHERCAAADHLVIPLDGQRMGQPRYAWSTTGFAEVSQTPLTTVLRAFESRRLATQGAERQRALLHHDARLARAMARRLGPRDTHLVVHQHLLPFLHREGQLGGRTFDVILRRLPLEALHARLDEAARRYPESPTLADFRAPAWLVRAEAEALERARRVVTTHAEVAEVFGSRATYLPPSVSVPEEARPVDGEAPLVFLGPVVGREGVHVLRAALEALAEEGIDLPLAVAGRDLEGGFDWGRATVDAGPDPLAAARAVAAPAWMKHDVRPLLTAVTRGVPVIASEACGLAGTPGVVSISTGDVDALADALRGLCRASLAHASPSL